MNAVGRTEPPRKGTMMLTTGERILILRQRHDLTQKELGKDIGVSAKSIARYEAGAELPSDVLRKLTARLGVSADYILGLRETDSRVKLYGDRPRPSLVPGTGDALPRRTYVDQQVVAVAR